uniref:Uncharacterized protein n=1 Tax=Eutreptiella gymnastica TaxID=73025 RepID=A0A7S4LH15_9EUGL|mmetsp:Transcript_27163/g.43130  ORF Transcript_27163/g.43130 Transcript_27163/m.43130 type:complete len:106 (+) Transcript_27163:44-361(+)
MYLYQTKQYENTVARPKCGNVPPKAPELFFPSAWEGFQGGGSVKFFILKCGAGGGSAPTPKLSDCMAGHFGGMLHERNTMSTTISPMFLGCKNKLMHKIADLDHA